MKAEEERKKIHDGCVYRHSCIKDESKCCYLSDNRCIVNDYSDNYIFKAKKEFVK